MRLNPRSSAVVAGVVLALTLLAASGAVLAAPTGTVHFYTSMQLEVVEPLIKEIEAMYPGLKIDLLYSGSVELEQRLWAEKEAGRVRADVVWAANPALFLNMKKDGLLMPYESPEAVHVPDWLKDEDNMFIAGRVHNMGIAYNTRVVPADRVPSTWQEFLEWGPRAAMASPLHSGTSFTALAAFVMADHLGWEWFEEARRRGVQVLRGTGDVTRALVSGEFAVIKGIDYTTAIQADLGAPVAFRFPKDGAIALPSPIAITSTSQNPEGAKAFVDFILSKRGQEFLVSHFFIPVRSDVEPPKGLPSADEINALPIDYDWMAEEGPALRARFAEIMD